MRFLTDECVSPTTAKLLRQLGHDVLDIKEWPNTPLRYEPRLKHLLTTTRLEELAGKLVLLEEKRHRIIKR